MHHSNLLVLSGVSEIHFINLIIVCPRSKVLLLIETGADAKDNASRVKSNNVCLVWSVRLPSEWLQVI